MCFGLVVLYFVGDKMADEADKLNNQLVMEMNELLERPLTKEEEFVVLVTKGRRLQELGTFYKRMRKKEKSYESRETE